MKRLTSFLVALSLATIVHAYDFQAGDLYYNILSDGTAEVTFQKQYSSDNYAGLTDVTIPSTVTNDGVTYKVTSIGESAFKNCTTMTSVIIPNSITSIKKEAFYGCGGITSITIPEGITGIEDYTFYDCRSLTSVIIPSNITSIGEQAFRQCSNLTNITVSKSVTSIGGDAFANTAWYTNQPSGLIYINNVLYKYKGAVPQGTTVVIREGTTSISGSAFSQCTSLTSIIIPETMASIGNSAFSACSNLTSITIPANITNIERSAFSKCTSLTSVSLPLGITSIESNTFYGCTKLTSVTLPENVTKIGVAAFCNCTSLKSISIPNSVTSIADKAFSQCENMTDVTIGEGVTSISSSAFSNCNSINSVVWNAKHNSTSPFAASKTITSFVFGDNVEIIPYQLCYQMTGLTSITIPESVQSIGEESFYGCTSLTSISISDGVTSIAESAFYGCTGLTSVTIGENVTDMDRASFVGCTNITSVVWNAKNCTGWSNSNDYKSPFYPSRNNITSFVLGSKVEHIPASLCDKMEKLTSITIPNSVTSIGDNAFQNCTGLTAITIPDNVTTIGKSAFSGCTGLTSATIGNGVTHIGSSAFKGCAGITSIIIPDNVTNIEGSAFSNCTGLTTATIGKNVQDMSSYAFGNCENLTTIVWNAKRCNGWSSSPFYSQGSDYLYNGKIDTFIFGDDVEVIPNSICEELIRLKSVTIGKNVTNINSSTFSGCDSLTTIVWNAKKCGGWDNGGSSPFYRWDGDNTITSFTFGNEVDSIPNYLCWNMKELTSITIPNSVTAIGDYAFCRCTGLNELTIGSGVTNIGKSAFSGCNALTSFIVDGGNTTYDSRDNCNALIETATNTLIQGCNTTTIPESITAIGAGAFQSCTGITSVTIPQGVTGIGDGAFNDCSSLASVTWNAKKCGGWSGYSEAPFYSLRSNITSFTFGNDVDSIPAYLCNGMDKLTTISIPNSVTSIGNEVFDNCTGLSSVTIGENIANVSSSIFRHSTNITSVVWNAKQGDKWEYYSRYSNPFSQSCNNITSFTFGDKVESIPAYLCYGMNKLISITIPENVKNIGSAAFQECENITSVTWNAKACQNWNNYSSGDAPFYSANGSNITTFTFGDKVDSIPDGLCEKMTKLTSVIIPESVKSIGASAFSGCTDLSSAVMGSNVTKIGNNAFYNCWGLAYLHIPNSVKMIGDNAFYNCYSLTSISIPNSVTRIGSGAFAGCNGITSINIPESVTDVGNSAFVGCARLTSVVWNAKRCNTEYNGTYTPFYSYYGSGDNPITSFTFGDNVESIPSNLCRGLDKLTDITIPENVISIGRNAFYNCRGITSVVWNAKKCGDWGGRDYAPFCDARSTITSFTFGDKVESIPAYLCYEMSKLSAITIPESVTGIGDGTFAICNNLTSCTLLSETPPTIGNGTFGYDSSMPITVPCGATQAYQNAWDYYYVFKEPAPQHTLTVYPQNYEMGDIQFLRSYSCSNDTAIMYATSYGGFQFARWDDDNTDNPRTVVVTSDTSFVAYYTTEQYTIYTEVSDAERGSVSDAVIANYLDYVTISAMPNYGYHFARWNDDNTDNPRSVQVMGDAVYTAYFDKNTYSVTALSANELQGSAYSDTAQAAYQDVVTLTASPLVGYQFAQWSDGNTDNPRTITLTCDTTLTAEFALAHAGQCGDDLYWKYDNHTLTISGTGSMYDYNESNLPWLLLRDTTTAVILERGITHIGNNAFSGLTKLNKIELPNTLASIGASAFAGCRKLYDIYSYAVEPPVADNTSFTNYNVYLYVPCDNLRDYQMDVVFGSFKYIQCIEAENTTTDGQVSVTPAHNETVFEWPADGSATTYTLQISKGDEVFCTLVFNADGQLTNIAFSAPARNGEQRHAPAAVLTQSGYRFTVTGLTSGTRYAYDLTVKDYDDTILHSYTGTFITKGENITTDLDTIEDSDPNGDALNGDNLQGNNTPRKVFRDGQVYILRGGKTYTITGEEVK